jgi:ribosome-binding protein aMBF1 (putative translation factor)
MAGKSAKKVDEAKKARARKEKRLRKRKVAIEIAEKVGPRITLHRKKKGLSQEKLAEEADLDRSEISLLEKGKRCPRLDTIARLAGVLGVPLLDLVEGVSWDPDADG